MNKDIISGKWSQLKGKAQAKWGDLTNDDFDVAEGNAEYLAGRLQERYGWAKDRAEKEVRISKTACARITRITSKPRVSTTQRPRRKVAGVVLSARRISVPAGPARSGWGTPAVRAAGVTANRPGCRARRLRALS